jgi:phage gpG-like protein
MIKLLFTVLDEKSLLLTIKDIQNKLKSFRPELMKTGEYLKDFYSSTVFDTEGQIYGSRWQQLSPTYASWKGKKYPGRGILFRTGRLRNSFRFTSTDTFLKLYNIAPYFAIHQTGGRNMPKRTMLALNQMLNRAIGNIIKKGLLRRL